MSDLVCLVADKNMEAALDGLLQRPQALGIRPLDYELLVHPRRDPGCFHEAPEFLRPYRSSHAHAIVLLDQAWDGSPAAQGIELQRMLEGQLDRAGLLGWAQVIVIDPELEVWLFSDSPWVEQCLGWTGQTRSLRSWLERQHLWPAEINKPADPKFAAERALYEVRKPRSSSIFRDLARNISVERCADGAFLRLKILLRQWFTS